MSCGHLETKQVMDVPLSSVGKRPLGSVKARAESDKSSREEGRDGGQVDRTHIIGTIGNIERPRVQSVSSLHNSRHSRRSQVPGFLRFFGGRTCTAADPSATSRLAVVPLLLALFAWRSDREEADVESLPLPTTLPPLLFFDVLFAF